MPAAEAFWNDLRHSMRLFRQSWAFTATAVAALALGIGANTAIFSLVNTVLLKPLPFPDPDRLVTFVTTSPQGSVAGASPAKFQHWRQLTGVVEHVAAFRMGFVNYTGGAFPEQLRSAQVSADYFDCFGVPVVRGRAFTPQEDLPGSTRVALVSHSLWTRRFDGDPAAIGRTILLSDEPYVVIGVVGAGFDVAEFGPVPEVWIPFQLAPDTTDQGHYFSAAGRLRPGVSLEQAQARLHLSGEEYRERFPTALGPNVGFSVQPYQEVFVTGARTSLLVLAGAVSFVLLIACANVASLLLVRATGRRREMAIRAAIGAGRGRIVRQLLAESVMLSLTGGVLGVILGFAAIRVLLSVNTANLPRVGEDGSLVAVDWRVLAFALALSVGTGVLFGLIPAFHGSRMELASTLKEGGGRLGTGVRQNRMRALLVVGEIALALVLLVGSALLIRTSIALRRVDPGYDVANVLTMRMSLTGPRFLTSAGVEQAVRDGVERLRGLPGVLAASAGCCVPLQGGYTLPFVIVGRPLDGPWHGAGGWLTISPGYFEVFKIPIKRGRAFTDRDAGQAPPVVLINETMARRFWPDGDPLNDRLVIGRGTMKEFADEPERQIVGIVGDVRDAGLNNDPAPRMYIPQAQLPDAANALNVRITPMAWIVRTRTAPLALRAAIEQELRQATGLPVMEVEPMDRVVATSTSRQRFNMLLMTVFGGAALLLAAIGIYGLMAYSVEQRTQEIGIRLALGAERRQVKNMVVLEGMRLAGAGLIIGSIAAFALTRVMASFLFGVEARDPVVFSSVPALLAAVALLAAWVPARRASGVNPIEALRCE